MLSSLGTGASPDLWDRYNVVKNSVMSEPAAELHGIPGINIGYSYGTVIEHNEVYNTTWCALSMGYGAVFVSLFQWGFNNNKQARVGVAQN